MSQVQTLGSGSGSFAPNSTMQEFDDFLSWGGSSTQKLNWYTSGFGTVNGVQGHPGVMSANTTGSAIKMGDGAANSPPIILGLGSYSVSWCFNIPTLSTGVNRYTLYVGLGQSTFAETNDGVYFAYSDNLNSGNWVLKTAAGGVRTAQNTSTAVATGWQTLTVNVNAAATSCSYLVNGVAIGTAITTNIPSNGVAPQLNYLNVLGSNPALLLDLFYMTFTATTAR